MNKNNSKRHVAVIGAGASGAVCAYYLLKSGYNVTLFDKYSPLATLLPTGGGRCNLAHAEFDFKALASNYPRGEKFLYSVFSKFSTAQTLELFEELGIGTYIQEDGKIFPVSNSAKEVRHKILNAITKLGGKFTEQEVTDISDFRTKFDYVVIAIGGHSGYKLLSNCGIHITNTAPSLVGLNTEEDFSFLSGTALKNVNICGYAGDMLFTHFGVSGPLIYTISSIKAFESKPYNVEIDLAPNLGDLQKILDSNPHKNFKNVLSNYLPQKVVEYILRDGIDNSIKACKIDGKTRDCITDKIHNFKITVTGTNKGAETVTAGGVELNEINPKTMELKKLPKVYCIGEVLNIDGFCGGFNLQNAWSTAYVCAEGIINSQI